jgi:Uma2 family endonuclease
MSPQALNLFGRAYLPYSAKKKLPTMYDLPSEYPEDPGMPDEFHFWQSELLIYTFRPPGWDKKRRMAAADLNLYYDPLNPSYYKRLDWCAAVGVREISEPRLSYVVWDEGVNPVVIVELLSPSTEDEDLGKTSWEPGKPPPKWDVYEKILKIPYYAVFSRYTEKLRVFVLKRGKYQEIFLSNKPVWFPKISLGLGVWQGEYHDEERLWIRWFDENDIPIPTPAEKAEKERQQAEKERQQAEKKWQQAEKGRDTVLNELEAERERTRQLLARLKAAGIETAI